MADEHPARAEPVPAWAVLRWPDHPVAIGGADQLADCEHGLRVGPSGSGVSRMTPPGHLPNTKPLKDMWADLLPSAYGPYRTGALARQLVQRCRRAMCRAGGRAVPAMTTTALSPGVYMTSRRLCHSRRMAAQANHTRAAPLGCQRANQGRNFRGIEGRPRFTTPRPRPDGLALAFSRNEVWGDDRCSTWLILGFIRGQPLARWGSKPFRPLCVLVPMDVVELGRGEVPRPRYEVSACEVRRTEVGFCQSRQANMPITHLTNLLAVFHLEKGGRKVRTLQNYVFKVGSGEIRAA